MKSISRIFDFSEKGNLEILRQCRDILIAQFEYLSESEAEGLLRAAQASEHPEFNYMVFVAMSHKKKVVGVAIASHFQQQQFVFLDYIATRKHKISGGIGGALYEQLRDEAGFLNSAGIFFDCLPDERELCLDDEHYKQNRARMKFYERFGARPMINTEYELPRDDWSVFHLVFDGIDHEPVIKMNQLQGIVRQILISKASKKCSEEYINRIFNSIKGDLELRPLKYLKNEMKGKQPSDSSTQKIGLVVNEAHLIHHVRERGYLESPVRVTSILKELNKTDFFENVPSKSYPDKHLEKVHDKEYLKFLKQISILIGDKATRYGDVFPIRNASRLPKDIELQIGYYCIDTSTPLNSNSYIAAREAVNCALTAADLVLSGRDLAYALVRPPGHHAERKYFGGFCYLNSNAVAAHYLSKHGKVAILDIDYHHGNGQQDIFYDRSDIFTFSIHADPEYAYPNFTGFTDEKGVGKGKGFNKNICLPMGVTGDVYHKSLKKAIKDIKKFQPDYLVLALGLDIAKGDPSGTWLLAPEDFKVNGELIAQMNLPTLIVQEGGYKNRVLGKNARYFFEGLWEGRGRTK